jgi:ribosome-associated protein
VSGEAAREVPVREGTIRLGQFLKLADLVDQGSDAKPLLAEGRVLVDGVVETRRGRQLSRGDVVTVTVISPEGPVSRSARVG